MTRHRGLTLALGLCALIGLGAHEARAESIVMTVTWSGGSLTFDSMVVSPFVLTASSTQLLLNNSAVDAYMSSHGSELVLPDLGATSNFPGGPSPLLATLTVQGEAQLTGAGTATSVLITTSESGFTTPSGEPGTLSNTQSDILASSVHPLTSGDQNVASTSSGPGASTALLPTHSSSTLSDSASIASIPSSYTLGSKIAVDLSGSTPGIGTTAQFQTLTVVGTFSTPEPASIILMLTGMPLPLVVLGLLRRRRAAA
jgi:hypothetical protein